jgi:hypothetical protein
MMSLNNPHEYQWWESNDGIYTAKQFSFIKLETTTVWQFE